MPTVTRASEARQAEEAYRDQLRARAGCHFFTDDDGVVHPIAKTCGHVKKMSAKEARERYGDDEAF